MIFYILVNPIVPCNKNNIADAFSQLLINFSSLMTKKGHQTYVFSNSKEEIECTNFAQVIEETEYLEIEKYIGSFNNGSYLTYSKDPKIVEFKDHIIEMYNINTIKAILKIEKENKHISRYNKHNKIIFHFYNQSTAFIANTFPYIPSCEFLMGCDRITYNNVIFCSDSYASEKLCNSEFIPKRFTIIPPLFDKTNFYYNKNSSNSNSVLYLGRIQECKGIFMIFKLAEIFPKIEFWIAGYCKRYEINTLYINCYQENIDNCEEINLDKYPNIKYFGIADLEKRKQLLSDCKVLIQPSQYDEPFGFNVIEAYMSGKPVITSDRGTFKETVNDKTGYRCNDIKEYSDAINNIFYNNTISNQDCYDESLKYDIEISYKKYMDFFSDLVVAENCLINPNLANPSNKLLLSIAKTYANKKEYYNSYTHLNKICKEDFKDDEEYLYHHILGHICYYNFMINKGYKSCKRAIELKDLDIDKNNLIHYEKIKSSIGEEIFKKN